MRPKYSSCARWCRGWVNVLGPERVRGTRPQRSANFVNVFCGVACGGAEELTVTGPALSVGAAAVVVPLIIGAFFKSYQNLTGRVW